MQLSVVILNYNVKSFLETCISSVQKAIETLDAEIIVIDNASKDGSKELMEKKFPNITYLYQHENMGFPKGNNIGVNNAVGEYICILNPDTIVAEDTFKIMLESYLKQEKTGIIGCKLIDGSGNYLPESKRGIPTPWVAFTKVLALYKLFPNNRFFNQYYAQQLSKDQEGKVPILVGAFMFMKRELYLKLGGFDEGCFMYSDDIDLSYVSLKNGYNNYYVPSTTVIHFKGESTLKDGMYMKRFKDAMQFFYKKHFKSSSIFNYFMQAGIFIFALKKKNEKKYSLNKPDFYHLISTDTELIDYCKDKFQNLKISSVLDDLKFENTKAKTEFLIDNALISYKEYINFITKNTKNNNTFKIKPHNSHFFIGSNDKNDKGEIIHLYYK